MTVTTELPASSSSDVEPDPLAAVRELPGGPFDVDFFLDPMCPFAWQTSVWIRRVAELRDVRVGWRFVSLYVIHEHDEVEQFAGARRSQLRGHQVHRVMDAVRDAHGNEAVGRLYEQWGRALWYGDPGERVADVAQGIDLVELLTTVGLPASLADEADDDAHDAVIRAETELAFSRAGRDVGTPIITYDPPDGGSFFGPVISSLPPDDVAVAIYDALCTLVRFPDFSEVKRTTRPPLDLPALRRS